MASSYKDSSPNKGGKKGGLKNSNAKREGPLDGPKKAAFNDKSVGVEPNEGAPHLPGKGVIGKVI